MIDPRCKCTMGISLTGDGCRYCQPQEYIDRLHDMLDEDRDASAENLALKREYLAALKNWKMDIEPKPGGYDFDAHHTLHNVALRIRQLEAELKEQADD